MDKIFPITALAGLLLLSAPVWAESPDVKYSKTLMTGEQVFNSVCVRCHAPGLVSAPSINDREKWKELAAEGTDELWGSAIAGLRIMPPMGGDPALYDIEVARAVNYMVGLPGVTFPEPTEKAVRAARTGGEKRAKARIAEYRAARK